MPPKGELVEIGGRYFLGNASILFDTAVWGLIVSVLEYGSVCFKNMTKTHMLGLEGVQYRALRIALGPMGSTPNNCLGVLGGIRIIELQIPCCCFLSIGPSFEGDPWSARGAEHGSLHHKIFRYFIIGYRSIREPHVA
jgi:hypothetical protein